MTMLADRPGSPLVASTVAVFALAAAGARRPPARPQVVPADPLPAAPGPDSRVVTAQPPAAIPPAPPDPWQDADAMHGPYASLCLDAAPCALDVITAEGSPPFDEYTVMIDDHLARLVVRIGNGWWFRDLGPRDASLGAPRQHGDTITVRAASAVVTCGLATSGVPHCR